MDVEFTIDLEKAMKSSNKDIVVNIINGAINNVIKSQNESSEKKIDLSFIKQEGIDTFLLVNLDLDTLDIFQKDSLKNKLSQLKNGIQFSSKEQEYVANMVMNVINNAHVYFHIQPSKNIMKASFKFDKIAYDDFQTEEFKSILKKLKKDSTFQSLNNQGFPRIEWKKNKISWDGYDSKDNPFASQEAETNDNKIMQETMLNSGILIIYNFPDKILKSKNLNFDVSGDGKTLTLNGSLKDIIEGKTDISNKVKYAK